jgi:hypothetical protein
MFLEVIADKLELEDARQRLKSCIQVTWDTLNKGIFDNLYTSILLRMKAYIAASD